MPPSGITSATMIYHLNSEEKVSHKNDRVARTWFDRTHNPSALRADVPQGCLKKSLSGMQICTCTPFAPNARSRVLADPEPNDVAP